VYLALLWLVTLAFSAPLRAEGSSKSTAPSYSLARIVNSATNTADALAPNTIAMIYGANLSYDTAALVPSDIVATMLPCVMAGVRLYVAGVGASLYYVSPRQINFLIPGLRPGDMDVFVAREGISGPHVIITVHDVGPGLYAWEPGMIAATDAHGNVITTHHPARPGDVVVLYGTGFGSTDPELVSGQVSMVPAQIQRLSDLRVLVAGTALNPADVFYAGVTPGSPGLYQVNLRLPKPLAPDPEIRIAIGDRSSPPMKLPVH
jgi:uncharacterized protein (TIGR03437 family)